jgi:hypothetical protein
MKSLCLVMGIVLTAAGSVHAADIVEQRAQEIVRSAGALVRNSPKVFVGSVKSVAWSSSRRGRAVVVVRVGIRGTKVKEQIVLPVQKGVDIHKYTPPFWTDLKFAEGSTWLVFVSKGNTVTYIAPLKSAEATIVANLKKAVEINSMQPKERLAALQTLLEKKSLKPVLLVNYGIEAAGDLVGTEPRACALLLSVATDSTNSIGMRGDALRAIIHNMAHGYVQDKRPTWAAEVKMLLEAAPNMEDSPPDFLLREYVRPLMLALELMGSRNRTRGVPSDVKLANPEKVRDALASMARKLEEGLPALKEKLAAAKAPTTKFPTEKQRERRIANLQQSIKTREYLIKFLKDTAKSAGKQATPPPGGDAK